MVKNIKKNGFSLLEACVVMAMVAIFVSMTATSYSKRHNTYTEADGHGRYECYRNAGGAIQQRYVEGNSARAVTGTTCVFRAPRYAKYILVNISGGGSAAAAGDFRSVFYSSIDSPMTINPGVTGGASTISINNETILSVSGGSGDLVVTSSAANKVSSCTFANTKYTCGSTPSCAQSGTNLIVNYCNSSSNFTSRTIPISQIKTYRKSWSGSRIVYRDLSGYEDQGIPLDEAINMIDQNTFETFYTLNVDFELTSSSVSLMQNYLKALNITDGIAASNPGALGSPGGVVIVW